MTLYYTETSDTYLSSSTLTTTEGSHAIFGFDIQDEQVRREPWSATQETSYNFIKEFVNGINGANGTRYYSSRMSNITNRTQENEYGTDDTYGPYYQLKFKFAGKTTDSDGLIGKNHKYQFVERYGEYNFENVSNTGVDEDNTFNYNMISNVTESVDILDNNEIVANNKGTTKRVIQYIYIN